MMPLETASPRAVAPDAEDADEYFSDPRKPPKVSSWRKTLLEPSPR